MPLGECNMNEKCFRTPCGDIRYWINSVDPARKSLVFLPGLTAGHRLFDKQVAYFQDTYNVLTWDAPGHAGSCIRYNIEATSF